MTDPREHWDSVHATKAPDAVSWYAPHLDTSLALLDALGLPAHAAILDVGGGISALVDDLLARGMRDVRVLDISANALAITRQRLGASAAQATFIVGDVLEVALSGPLDVWHDRAVFHFLTSPADQAAYAARAAALVRPGGHVLLSTFADDGPLRCSGLEVARHSPEGLHAAMGPDAFTLIQALRTEHTTPSGSVQRFATALLQRR
jgi:2-polyprenyl-3-methyl-5-hydroxy-6-metoxy-1,4-benzoquinol methylase